MLTKIKLPKLIALFIITLGLYSLLWLAQRRNEIVKTYDIALPGWQWIVLPLPIALILSGGAGYAAGLLLPYTIALLLATIIGTMLASVYLGISIWWMIKFGGAVERITNGRMPTLWTLLYWIFLSFIVIIVLQYFFNKLPATTQLPSKPTGHPSKKFVTASVIVIVGAYLLFSLAGAIAGIMLSAGGVDGATARDAQLSELSKKADLLDKQYQYCSTELNKKYPEVSPDQVDTYTKEFDQCEKLRFEQNATIDEYNNVAGEWWKALFN